jgi:N-acetylmuramoyl-L-alanine amidase
MGGGTIERRTFLRRLSAVLASTAGAGLALDAAAAPARAATKARRHIVVLDAGHGGIDPGTIGVSGVYEKEITFDTTMRLARELERGRRYKVVLTRKDDEFVPLHERVARARAADGEVFLSIHADALPDPDMRGASVFTLSEKASDKEAAALAARENKVDLIAGIDLSESPPEVTTILIDLARRQTNNLSIGFARHLVSELDEDIRMLNNSLRSAGFAVLKAPDIPSSLVELGCLSNRKEDRLLRTPSYRQKLARDLGKAIDDYFDLVLKA